MFCRQEKLGRAQAMFFFDVVDATAKHLGIAALPGVDNEVC